MDGLIAFSAWSMCSPDRVSSAFPTGAVSVPAASAAGRGIMVAGDQGEGEHRPRAGRPPGEPLGALLGRMFDALVRGMAGDDELDFALSPLRARWPPPAWSPSDKALAVRTS
jgi:hypothetical protein